MRNQRKNDDAALPGGQLPSLRSSHGHDLSRVDLHALLLEIAHRLDRGESPNRTQEVTLAADQVVEQLERAIDIHWNRYSLQRQCDLFWMFLLGMEPPRPPIEGETYLDLGCGSIHPYGFAALLCLLGAERAWAVDLAPTQDVSRAVRNVARLADRLLQDPGRVVRDLPITRDQIERNLRRFDVEALRRGDPEGLRGRVEFRRDSADRLSLEDGAVRVVVSHSLLEHVDDIHAVLDELFRVTRKGGFGVHAIDAVDHASYADDKLHPLDFLRKPAGGMVNGSNRIRLHEFPALFEEHGFVVQEKMPGRRIELTDKDVASFANPWRDLPREYLEVVHGRIVVRRP